MPTKPLMDYRDQLRAELRRRQNVNARYSLRSFARAVGLSPAFLSKILCGNQHLSVERAMTVAVKLGYSENQTRQFCKLVQLSTANSSQLRKLLDVALDEATDGYSEMDLDRFQMISDWYHYGLLYLIGCKGIASDIAVMASHLGITLAETQEAMDRLIRLGMIHRTPRGYFRTNHFLATPSDIPSQAIRHFHAQMMEKAKLSLEAQNISERDITGTTLSITRDQIPLVKLEIKKFRRRLAKLLETTNPTDVYQLNVQFFRLSHQHLSLRKTKS